MTLVQKSVMEDIFFFNRFELARLADEYRVEFQTAVPFPHVVIDNFLPDDLARHLVFEADTCEEPEWICTDHGNAKKKAIHDDWNLGPVTRHVLAQFNSASFLDFTESVTGIGGLISDPHFLGGGFHQIEPGGFLGIHADFNRHERLGLDRRVNALLYLNPGWQESWGGHLELWDDEMSTLVRRIAPLYNRLVLFVTTDTAFHGHPEPLACPPDRKRRSLALYYYSNGRPEHERSALHYSIYRRRPEDSKPADNGLEAKETNKIVPPIVTHVRQWAKATRNSNRRVLDQLLPPVLTGGGKKRQFTQQGKERTPTYTGKPCAPGRGVLPRDAA